MKSLKLSLVAALAGGSFSLVEAKSLEEAIKDVEIEGSVRYRYDSFYDKSDSNGNVGDYNNVQRHKFKAALTTGVNIGDGFKIVGTLRYNASDSGEDGSDGGWASGENVNQGADTSKPINLQEAYLQYSNEDFGTTINLGRQRLNTIWTDNDNLDGSAGMKAQILNNSLVGTTLTAFAVDSVDDDPDFVYADDTDSKNNLFRYNIYGAAAIFDMTEENGVAASLWYAYEPKRINLYAVTVGYTLPLGEDGSWNLQAQYLGNSVHNEIKDSVKGGSLYTVAGTLEIAGFDGTLGYTAYGKKDALTVNVLEDKGDLITPGEEIQGLEGSSLNGSTGKNQFAFASAGYTINGFRIGADYVYGGTKAATTVANGSAGKKQEIVGRLEYAHTNNLVFSGFYSNVTHKAKHFNSTIKKNNIRFEARYDF